MKKIIAIALLFITFFYPMNDVLAEDNIESGSEKKYIEWKIKWK